MKRARRRRAQPEIPVQARRNGLRLFRTIGDEDDVLVARGGVLTLNAPRAVHPDVHLAHGTNRAALNQLLDPPVIVGRVPLIAHLRRELELRGRLTNEPRFRDVVGERLLAVDVLARLEGEEGREDVRVLAGAHDDRVEVAGAIEHLPEVGELFGLRMLRADLLQRRAVHVTEDRDVLRRDALEVRDAASTGANHRDVELVADVLTSQNRGRANGHACGSERASDELTASDSTRPMRFAAHGCPLFVSAWGPTPTRAPPTARYARLRGGHPSLGILNVLRTYSAFARESATTSLDGESVSMHEPASIPDLVSTPSPAAASRGCPGRASASGRS